MSLPTGWIYYNTVSANGMLSSVENNKHNLHLAVTSVYQASIQAVMHVKRYYSDQQAKGCIELNDKCQSVQLRHTAPRRVVGCTQTDSCQIQQHYSQTHRDTAFMPRLLRSRRTSHMKTNYVLWNYWHNDWKYSQNDENGSLLSFCNTKVLHQTIGLTPN